uniref:Uncharacterized protein n=1 Tax=Rhizophora mucronata TaxID=61149 RepID=A0A2P2P596_RHIMU
MRAITQHNYGSNGLPAKVASSRFKSTDSCKIKKRGGGLSQFQKITGKWLLLILLQMKTGIYSSKTIFRQSAKHRKNNYSNYSRRYREE